jgi:hypothetical protein
MIPPLRVNSVRGKI